MSFLDTLFGPFALRRSFAALPLDAWARKLDVHSRGMDPTEVQQTVTELPFYPYGGWMEDRSTLLKNTYVDESKKYIHLGVDFWIPEETSVFLPHDQVIIAGPETNEDQNGGWGGVVLTENQSYYFLYAHLDPGVKPHRVSGLRGYPTVLGHVGSQEVNGGWIPHLHLQAIAKSRVPWDSDLDKALLSPKLHSLLSVLDGYATTLSTENILLFPDPVPLLP